MNQEVKAKWLAALRSGEYTQGHLCLRTQQHEFCCLGVLVDLHAKETGGQWVDEVFGYTKKAVFTYLGGHGVLPDEVRKWVGLAESDPTVRYENSQCELSWVNDNGADFKQIADLIEQQL